MMQTLLTQLMGSQVVHHYWPQVLALTVRYLSGMPSGAKVFEQQQQSASAA